MALLSSGDHRGVGDGAAAPSPLSSSVRTFCYLDLDVADHRARYSRACAFVAATDTRYGWSSKDLRRLGGSELKRVPDMHAIDHDFAASGTGESIAGFSFLETRVTGQGGGQSYNGT